MKIDFDEIFVQIKNKNDTLVRYKLVKDNKKLQVYRNGITIAPTPETPSNAILRLLLTIKNDVEKI